MKVICERNNYQVLSSSIESIQSKRRIDNVVKQGQRFVSRREYKLATSSNTIQNDKIICQQVLYTATNCLSQLRAILRGSPYGYHGPELPPQEGLSALRVFFEQMHVTLELRLIFTWKRIIVFLISQQPLIRIFSTHGNSITRCYSINWDH